MDTIWTVLLVVAGPFIALPIIFMILDIFGKIIQQLGIIGIILILLFLGLIVHLFNS